MAGLTRAQRQFVNDAKAATQDDEHREILRQMASGELIADEGARRLEALGPPKVFVRIDWGVI